MHFVVDSGVVPIVRQRFELAAQVEQHPYQPVVPVFVGCPIAVADIDDYSGLDYRQLQANSDRAAGVDCMGQRPVVQADIEILL